MTTFDNSPIPTSRRVLIVDDQRAVHKDFRKILLEKDGADSALDAAESLLFGGSGGVSSGFPLDVEIDHAYQGEEALQMVDQAINAREPYGIAFIDVRMPPGIDGIQTARQIWRIDPDLQIVICTAYSDYSFGEVIEQLEKSDQFLFLKKPFEIVEVRQIVAALLRRWELSALSRRQIQLLQRESDKTNSIIRSTYDGYFVTDGDGRIVEWSEQSEKLFGWQQEEVLNRPVAETLFPFGAMVAGMEVFLQQTNEKGLVEVSARCRDGKDFPCEVTLARFDGLHDYPGQSTQMYFFLRDISARLAEEARLSQTQKLEAIGQLAAGIAHEINTPTQYVTDNAQFLRDSFTDISEVIDSMSELVTACADSTEFAEHSEHIAKIKDELDLEFLLEEIPQSISQSLEGLNRIASIVKAMKEFSHPDGETQLAPFDVNGCIRSTTTVARNEWKYIADLVLSLEDNLPPAIGHKGEFNQTILNLVINAAHAIEGALEGDQGIEKGVIEIRTRLDNGFLEVQIEDTGTGIPRHLQDRIFDPFFTTKRVGKGTGQGLAIAFNMAQKYGGSIWFDSEEGAGTTFFLRIPALDDDASETLAEAEFCATTGM